ncbi:hypothetical protein U1Q18_052684 [Sarracenia purpurea var. burkii]
MWDDLLSGQNLKTQLGRHFLKMDDTFLIFNSRTHFSSNGMILFAMGTAQNAFTKAISELRRPKNKRVDTFWSSNPEQKSSPTWMVPIRKGMILFCCPFEKRCTFEISWLFG